MPAQIAVNRNFKKERKVKRKVMSDELEIIERLKDLKKDLDYLEMNMNYITDPILIDSYIYETKAVHMKYQYYLNLCKGYEKQAY